ncbi:MAG: 5-methyltetrahydropteroyltriglutamate--homocysteine S-methyltransferase [Alphaproteobacteria bacterium]|nr:5-methyltetrahydropteroyltriglutamate--homocysteine S-methyltransferase [Alphaproteobacteria bacterium]
MTQSANLGYPRIGRRRELKKVTEAYWKGDVDAISLLDAAAGLRARHWRTQKDAGIGIVPSNDFSFYDQVLDMTAILGAVPTRFGHEGGRVALDTYFGMARGTPDASAMEMTKWFDTNYHYIVPEIGPDQRFSLSSLKPVEEFREAQALGIHTRPVLIGPVTYLLLAKPTEAGFEPLALLDRVLPLYAELLARLSVAGADWVQMDEPALALDLTDDRCAAFDAAYRSLSTATPRIMLTTYFGALGDNLETAAGLPVDGLHVDLVRAPGQLEAALHALPADRVLSLGVVDGRNVWRCNLSGAFERIEQAIAARGPERLQIAPSCSLLHVPQDLGSETGLDDELRSWLAFADQKLAEVAALATAATAGKDTVADAFEASDAAVGSRAQSPRIHNPAVKARTARVSDEAMNRASPFRLRRARQQAATPLPAFPTTTIGSFPQTAEVRKARAAHRRGRLDAAAYEAFLRTETEKAVRLQEKLEIDVLVHGEFERNDMVEYFGEQLDGFAFTEHGWVQSFGSRYVKPPIIFGDVSRPKPMTTAWSAYAQSLTERPMKGMLTGPVTILQWSFVRDDQARSETCRQIALAIRDEVVDLERCGIRFIQIDEPALREGLPLRRDERDDYLGWAVGCFRLAAAGAADETQIHTHMCYCEFNDIMPSIAALDADVISIETSRSHMELLDAFIGFSYPNDIGPGVYDIHSPRCPDADEMAALIDKATERLQPDQIWVNPDCGLKTRSWAEVVPALENMVEAARRQRARRS